jgi:hypothetical protein
MHRTSYFKRTTRCMNNKHIACTPFHLEGVGGHVQPFGRTLLLQQDGTEGGTTLLADSKIRGAACMCPCKVREGLAADT